MLSSLAVVRLAVGIAVTDSSQDAILTQWLGEADALIKEWCHQAFEPATQVEYLSGRNQTRIRTRQRPVIQSVQTGNTATGSAVVSGLGSTASLLVGMPCVGAGIPAGATVGVVGSGQVTLSAGATATATATQVNFGLSVWLDGAGAYGSNVSAFDSTKMLTPGLDYALVPDMPDGFSSRSGLIERLNGVWPGGALYARGLLAASVGPGRGNVRVQYSSGFTTIPKDLETAENLLVAFAYNLKGGTARIQGEGFQGYNYSLASVGTPEYLLKASGAAFILERYRDRSMGVG